MGRDDENGVATVLAVTMIGLLLVFTFAASGVSALLVGHRRAQAAADLAALGGAGALQAGRDGCAAAGSVARENTTTLTGCRIERDTVVVRVRFAGPPLLGRQWPLEARARAGPVGLGGPVGNWGTAALTPAR